MSATDRLSSLEDSLVDRMSDVEAHLKRLDHMVDRMTDLEAQLKCLGSNVDEDREKLKEYEEKDDVPVIDDDHPGEVEQLDRAAAERHRLFRQILEALETPSIFLIKAVRTDDSVPWKTRIMSNLLLAIVFSVQTFFSLWFVGNFVNRRNPTLIAPGINLARRKADHPRRTKWLHDFSTEVVSAIFLAYLTFTVWQRRTLRVFRFYLRVISRGDDDDAENDDTNDKKDDDGESSSSSSNLKKTTTPKLRLWLVYLGFVNQVITMYAVILMTYILFRLSPRPHDLLLNAVALEYIADFDKSMVQSLGYQPELRALLVMAQRDLAILADQQFDTNVCAEIRDLETANFSTIVLSFFTKGYTKKKWDRSSSNSVDPSSSPTTSSSTTKDFFSIRDVVRRVGWPSLHYYQAPQHRMIEVVSRINRHIYLFGSFTRRPFPHPEHPMVLPPHQRPRESRDRSVPHEPPPDGREREGQQPRRPAVYPPGRDHDRCVVPGRLGRLLRPQASPQG